SGERVYTGLGAAANAAAGGLEEAFEEREVRRWNAASDRFGRALNKARAAHGLPPTPYEEFRAIWPSFAAWRAGARPKMPVLGPAVAPGKAVAMVGVLLLATALVIGTTMAGGRGDRAVVAGPADDLVWPEPRLVRA